VITITRMSLMTLSLAVFGCSSHCSGPAAAASASAASAGQQSANPSKKVYLKLLEIPQVAKMPLKSAQEWLAATENFMRYSTYALTNNQGKEEQENCEFAHRVHDTYLLPKIHLCAVQFTTDFDPSNQKALQLNTQKGHDLRDEALGDRYKAYAMLEVLEVNLKHARAQTAVLAAQNRDKDTIIQALVAQNQLLQSKPQQKAVGVPQAPGGAK